MLVHRLLMDSLTNEQAQQPQAGSAALPPPQCSLNIQALQSQAEHCNSKKLAAKNAQEASDRCARLFVGLCVRVSACLWAMTERL